MTLGLKIPLLRIFFSVIITSLTVVSSNNGDSVVKFPYDLKLLLTYLMTRLKTKFAHVVEGTEKRRPHSPPSRLPYGPLPKELVNLGKEFTT